MTKSEQLIFAFVAGCVMGLIVGLMIYDFSMRAHANERDKCKERPDSAAYYMRKPGESHSVETCQFVPRYGDPAWIPYMSHPLKQGKR